MGAPAGADDDFDAFYRAEFGRLAGALRLLCGDRVAAEELAQEAFVRAYAAWERVAALDRPAGWLYTTGFNLVRRRWRDRARGRLMTAPRPPAGADDAVTRVDVAEALATLPLNQRKAVVARHVLGWSTEETAALLGISPGALRALLHRAVVSLRLAPALSAAEEE